MVKKTGLVHFSSAFSEKVNHSSAGQAGSCGCEKHRIYACQVNQRPVGQGRLLAALYTSSKKYPTSSCKA
jgi:hypothetical protein